MKGLGAYIIVLFCANFAQKIYAFTAECDLGILHHQPALFNSPRDVVVDLLDLKPADYLKGVSVTRHGDNMVLYGFDDAKLRGTSITLIMGNQRLYVMPQAHNLQVKWSENMTTTEIIITYEIGGSTFKRYYHEEPFSTISSFFWSRMFSPDTAVLKIKAPSKTKATGQSAATTNANAQYETPLDYANAFIQQWNEALESFWSMVIPTNDHRRREVSAEDSDDEGSGSCEPRSVVELSEPTTYARIAKSQSWRRMKVDKLMCVTFDNIEARWNGMLFHKIKIPVPMQSTEFTVCFDAGEKQTKTVIVSALVDGVWVESYYAVQGVGTEEVQLRLVDAEEHFAYYPGLPSRDRAGECVHGGEGFTLH
uniref:Uncharacterized protein n=1 Tax=Babesia bovis TaxID=5865 RepID=S6C7Z2_BABBO|nr:hypothetical protein [Babesia bovis]